MHDLILQFNLFCFFVLLQILSTTERLEPRDYLQKVCLASKSSKACILKYCGNLISFGAYKFSENQGSELTPKGRSLKLWILDFLSGSEFLKPV